MLDFLIEVFKNLIFCWKTAEYVSLDQKTEWFFDPNFYKRGIPTLAADLYQYMLILFRELSSEFWQEVHVYLKFPSALSEKYVTVSVNTGFYHWAKVNFFQR